MDRLLWPLPQVAAIGRRLDVGVDTRTGVNHQDYKPPYPFNGAIHGVTFKLGPTQLTELEERTIQEAYAVAND